MASSLPTIQTNGLPPSSKDFSQLQSTWKGVLTPVLNNPLSGITILPNVQLKSGVNVVPHLLQQKQQGWMLTDLQGPATVYRSGPFNSINLILTASTACTVSIGVF